MFARIQTLGAAAVVFALAGWTCAHARASNSGAANATWALLPKPRHVELLPRGFSLPSALVVTDPADEARGGLGILQGRLAAYGTRVQVAPQDRAEETGALGLVLASHLPAEGYTLEINSDGISIRAGDAEGFFYAIQTLLQIMDAALDARNSSETSAAVQLPGVRIEDAPRFPWRGFMLDSARHFLSTETILRIIDIMASYKMNRFHWHLTDDQGWRLDVPARPRLTSVGAWRQEADGTRYGGFYSAKDVRTVVAYAAARHVTVVPEIDMPGHASAAIAAYPELSCYGVEAPIPSTWGVFEPALCPCSEETYLFVRDVLAQVRRLFPGGIVHLGGDEVMSRGWGASPACQRSLPGVPDEELVSRFWRRILGELPEGRLILWDDAMSSAVPASATIQAWRFEGARGPAASAARMGHDVIHSPIGRAYLDKTLDEVDLRDVYGFEPIPPGLDAVAGARVLGGEVLLWGERVTDDLVEPKLLPRALAMAEVLWSADAKDFADFEPRVHNQMPRLRRRHVRVGRGFPHHWLIAQPMLDTPTSPESPRRQVLLSSNDTDTPVRLTVSARAAAAHAQLIEMTLRPGERRTAVVTLTAGQASAGLPVHFVVTSEGETLAQGEKVVAADPWHDLAAPRGPILVDGHLNEWTDALTKEVTGEAVLRFARRAVDNQAGDADCSFRFGVARDGDRLVIAASVRDDVVDLRRGAAPWHQVGGGTSSRRRQGLG